MLKKLFRTKTQSQFISMIKTLGLALALILSFAPQWATAERKPVALGMLGGITSSSFWGSDIKEFDLNLWPTVGMSLAFHLPVFLGIEMDVLYVSKDGSIRTYPVDASTGLTRTVVNAIKLQALEIPFLLKITAPTENEVMPIFFGGPSLAYIFSKDSYSEFIDISSNGTVSPVATTPYIEKTNIPELDWSLCLGAGVEWGLGSFQLRFNFGKNSLDKSSKYDVKTVTIALMGGFIF